MIPRMTHVEAGRFDVLNPRKWPGSRFDWAFSALAVLLVATGYYVAWEHRKAQLPSYADVPVQAAWLAVTLFMVGAGISAWLRDRQLESVVPKGYLLSAAGCLVFAVGILSGGPWQEVYGTVTGVPAAFRPPNLLEIAGAGMIVTGPLRSAIARGELLAGPTALISSALLLAAVTFFSQFDHPYVNPWAFDLHQLPNAYAFVGQELGALSLLMQATIVTSVILMTLRQIRLPPGSLTFMLATTAVFICTQTGLYQFIWVAALVGVLSDLLLVWAAPRSDRLLQLRVFAAATGALLPGVYLAYVAIAQGTYWSPDMIYGTILACGFIGWLVSYLTFPERDVARAAAVLWPPMDQDSTRTAPDITVDRLDHALKVLQSSRDLGESPLVWMRCLPSHNASSLRQVIVEAISSIRSSSSQVDAQAGEILELYYVRRIGGHYAVELRVGLSRAAYFNRRSYGVRRLVDRLKELEEKAAPA